MKASPQEFTQLLAYIGASRELMGWISGARAFALLSAAVDSGVLDALRARSTPEELAAATNMGLKKAADLCLALEAYGVVEREGNGYQLTRAFALLSSPTAAVPLAHAVRHARVMVGTLETLALPDAAYTALSSDEVLAMAEGSGISPLSSSPHVGSGATAQTLPEVAALWQGGARHLEVGCGIGNALLGTALTFPRVTTVGIEIDATTAAEAQRRADVLGIADRVEVRRMDACELQDEGVYDTIQWSQSFFPAASRPIVLKAMHRALKSGGYLFMPWFPTPSDDPSARRKEMWRMTLRALRSGGASFVSFLNDIVRDSPARRKEECRLAAVEQLVFSRWGVPVPSAAELASEIEGSGFRVLRTLFVPVNQFYLSRGILLAQRENA